MNFFTNNKKELNTDKQIDDWDLDIFDMSAFGEAEPVPDDRNPILTSSKNLASGIGKGLTQTTIKEMLRKALPATYGEVFDTTDALEETYSEVINEANEKLRPLKTDIKRVGRKAVQQAEGVLPEKWLAKLKEITESDDEPKYDQVSKDAAIEAQLAKIFTIQQEAQISRDKIEEQKDNEKRYTEFKQHKDTLSQLDAIRQATQSLSLYNTSVNVQYQRKSLELQFRQHDIGVKTLEVLTKQYNEFKTELAGIKKNTGLPEYVKLTKTESLKEALRNRFLDSVTGGALYKRTTRFLPGMLKQFGNDFKNGLDQFTSFAGMGLMAGEGKLDQMEMMREFGEETNPYQNAGEKLGNFLRGVLTKNLAGRLEASGKVNRVGNQASLAINNLEAIINGKLQNRDYANESGLKGTLLDFVQYSLNRYNQKDVRLQRDSIADLSKPGVITNRFTKSVTEIIPGYLSRILREVTSLRTGDPNVSLVEYDYMKNKFSDPSGIKQNVINAITKDGTIQRSVQFYTDSITRRIDSKGVYISKEDKEKLRPFFMKLARDNKVKIDKAFLSNPASFESLGSESAIRIAKAFSEYLQDDEDGSKELEIVQTIRSLPVMMGNPLGMLQEMVNNGQSSYLEELGLFRKGSKTDIDLDRVTEIVLGQNTPKPSDPTTGFINPQPTPPFKPQSPSSLQTDKEKEVNQVQSKIENVIQPKVDRQSTDSSEPKETLKTLNQNTEAITKVVNSIEKAFDKKQTQPENIQPSFFKQFKEAYQKQIPQEQNKGTKKSDQVVGDVYVEDERFPRLSAKALQMGKYIDSVTGKVIKSLKDVQGDIINTKGLVVLSREDFNLAKVRLPNINFSASKPFIEKSFREAVGLGLDGLTSAIPLAGRTAFELWKNTFKLSNKSVALGAKGSWWLAKNLTLGIGSWIKGKAFKTKTNFKSEEEAKSFTATAAGATVERLDHLLNMFNDRVKDESVEGDYNGSGFRDGSVKDKLYRSRLGQTITSKLPIKVKDHTEELVNLFKKYTKKQERQMNTLIDEVNENGDIAAMSSVGGSIMDLLGGGKGGKGGRGRLGRIKGLLGSSGKLLGKTAMIGGAGYLGYNAYQDMQKGNYGAAALEAAGATALMPGSGKLITPVASKLGLQGVTGAIGRNLGPIGTVAYGAYEGYQAYKKGDNVGVFSAGTGTAGALAGGAAGAAIGTALFPGVGTIVGGAIGGIAGWFGGSAMGRKVGGFFKNMTRSINDYDRIRLAMYGFSDTKYANQILQLESLVQEATFEAQGRMNLNPKKLDGEAILETMGVNKNDPSEVQRFQTWFLDRFRLSYLAAASLLNRLAKGTTLDNLDNQNQEVKSKWMKGISEFNVAYYENMTSPFRDLPSLQLGPKETKEVIDGIINKLPKPKEENKPAESIKAVATGTTVAATNGLVKTSAQTTDVNNTIPKAVVKEPSLLSSVSKGVLSAIPGAMFTMAGSSLLKNLFNKENKVTELNAILYKTLGLVDLDKDKVTGLLGLIQYTARSITYTDVATFKGSFDDLVRNAQGLLGSNSSDISTWVKDRYLPVILEFATVSFGLTKMKLPDVISSNVKPADALSIASAVRATKNKDGVSVWNVTTSPWSGYKLSNSVEIINSHYIALKDKSGNNTLKANEAEESKVRSEESKSGSLWSKIATGAANAWDKTKSMFSNAYESTKQAVSNAAQSAGSYFSNMGDNVSAMASAGWESVVQGTTGKLTKGREAYRDAIWEAMGRHGITSKNEVAAFLAQIAHETGDLKWTEELASGAAYNDRSDLGNTRPGDGPRFKGRGLIQLTGRANYEKFSKAIGRPDIMQNPELVSKDPKLAVESAIYYWNNRKGLREAAQKGDIKRVTKLVNGGYNGLQDRVKKYQGYLAGNGPLWKAGALPSSSSAQQKGGRFEQLSTEDVTQRRNAILNSNLSNEQKRQALSGLNQTVAQQSGGQVQTGHGQGNLGVSTSAPAPANYQGTGSGYKEVMGNISSSLVELGKKHLVKLKASVDFSGMKPDFMKMLYAAVGEYVQKVGKITLQVTDAYRSFQNQVALYQKYGPGRAAKPGTSRHGFGIAIDINNNGVKDLKSGPVDKFMNSGIPGKYGFHRPLLRRKDGSVWEPWHIENKFFTKSGKSTAQVLTEGEKQPQPKPTSQPTGRLVNKRSTTQTVQGGYIPEQMGSQVKTVESVTRPLSKAEQAAQAEAASRGTGQLLKASITPEVTKPITESTAVSNAVKPILTKTTVATGSMNQNQGGVEDAGRTLLVGGQVSQPKVYQSQYQGERYKQGSVASLGEAFHDMKEAWTGQKRDIQRTRQEHQAKQDEYLAKSATLLEQQLAVQKESLDVLKNMLVAIQENKVTTVESSTSSSSNKDRTSGTNTSKNSNMNQPSKPLIQPMLDMKQKPV